MNSHHKYHILRACDKSACSSAYITYNANADRISALKVFNNNSQITPQRAFNEELDIYRKLEAAHISCIPKLHLASTDNIDVEPNLANYKHFYGFFELEAGEYGDLLDIIIKYKEHEKKLGLPERVAKFFFMQIVNGLEQFHQARFVHRDIKPHNMVITNNLELKLIDFGFTIQVGQDGLASGNKGTPGYKAPETKNFTSYDGYKADIFSAGMCLFLLVAPETLLKDLGSKLSEDCANLLKALINNNPDRRPSLNEIKGHKWFADGVPSKEEVKAELRKFLDKIWMFSEKGTDDLMCSKEIKETVAHKIMIREKNPEKRKMRKTEEKCVVKTEEDQEDTMRDIGGHRIPRPQSASTEIIVDTAKLSMNTDF